MTNNVFIGWDSREHEAYAVAEHSIVRRSPSAICTALKLDVPYLTRPIERKDGQLWCPISEAPMATEFAISRFCVPFLFKNHGWTLFVDCDIVCLADIAELFAMADPQYAIMCVKHKRQYPPEEITVVRDTSIEKSVDIARELAAGNGVAFYHGYKDLKAWANTEYPQADVWYTERNGDPIGLLVPQNTPTDKLPSVACGYYVFEWIDPDKEFGTGVQPQRLKMDQQFQTFYARKNWSSVVLWNCDHLAHDRFTLEHLNTWPGRDLHAFKWLQDEEIGELPPNWNYLVDVNLRPNPIKIAHFTLGGPWLPNWKGGSCDDIWLTERKAMG